MLTAPNTIHPRRSIYYWKCDRPAAFHGTGPGRGENEIEGPLVVALKARFPEREVQVRAAGGQGNHLTFVAQLDGVETFVRVEDGPERDDYMDVESRMIVEVGMLGVPTPKIHASDASRQTVPFAWQVMDLVSAPDLNQLRQQGRCDLSKTAVEIGAAVARWQALTPGGFGPFDPEILRSEGRLVGFHSRYRDYFYLNFDRHLDFLVHREFLTSSESEAIRAEIGRHADLLDLAQGCLVHKDLALWNILGSEDGIAAYIDWDDCISGDPMDDLSLLGCFHDGDVLDAAILGYRSVRPLPEDCRQRFWLHLLRNMIVKAVIRVGAGYFERSGSFYLIGAGSSGEDLKAFTRARLMAAVDGLRADQPIETL